MRRRSLVRLSVTVVTVTLVVVYVLGSVVVVTALDPTACQRPVAATRPAPLEV